MPKIYFRADASAQIGYGHFIRTLAIADMLKDDFDCKFYTSSPTEYQIRELEKICDYCTLCFDNALSDFLNILQGGEIVVLDNYFYTDDYFNSIMQKGCKLVVVGPMPSRHYNVDMLLYGIPLDTFKFTIDKRTKLYYGFEYAFLRKEFREIKCDQVQRNCDIVVCLGGSDPLKLTNKILTRLLNICYNGNIHVIAGDSVFIDDIIKSHISHHKNLTAKQIVELFDSCRLAILSASTITTEALSRGIPVIAGYYVDNQINFYNTLNSRHYIYGLGDIRLNTLEQLSTDTFNAIAEKMIYKFDATVIKQRYIEAFKTI